MDGGAQLTLIPISWSPGQAITGDSPGININGSVAELTRHGDGTIVAEIRIPGPPVP